MEIINYDGVNLPVLPGVNVQVQDIRVEVEISDCLLPSVHIDAKVSIRFPW